MRTCFQCPKNGACETCLNFGFIFEKTDFIQPPDCSCQECKDKCKHPGWLLPEEAELMLNTTEITRLMLDYWWHGSTQIFVLAAASTGREGKLAPEWPHQCTFQTSDGLCELHGKPYKPFECRMAYHKPMQKVKVKPFIAQRWNTPKGKEVIEKWIEKLGAMKNENS